MGILEEKGPLRKVVDRVQEPNAKFSWIIEVYECGHASPPKTDFTGEATNATRRRCWACRDGKPPEWRESPDGSWALIGQGAVVQTGILEEVADGARFDLNDLDRYEVERGKALSLDERLTPLSETNGHIATAIIDGNRADLRKGLVRLAAIATAWVQVLDRENGN